MRTGKSLAFPNVAFGFGEETFPDAQRNLSEGLSYCILFKMASE